MDRRTVTPAAADAGPRAAVAAAPRDATAPAVLVIGCGNLLCGDDAAGPVCISRLRDRGLPAGVECVDCGTAGIEVAFRMRGVPELIMIDACRGGGPPGALLEVAGDDLELPAPAASFHAFRWDHALAFGRWLLGADYPRRVTAWLIAGEAFAPGDSLSPAVDRAIDTLCDRLCARLGDRQLDGPGDRQRPRHGDERRDGLHDPPAAASAAAPGSA